MSLYVVTGPPCSGKSTWVQERATLGDIVVDLDRIALAITSEDTVHHEYPAHIRRVAVDMRKTAVAYAVRYAKSGNAYIIHAKPNTRARSLYYRSGAQFVDLTAPLDVLLERAGQHRPPWVADMIRRWWTDDEQD